MHAASGVSGPLPTDMPGSARGHVRAVLLTHGERWAIVAVWVAMSATFWALRPHLFGTAATFKTIFSSQAATVFLAIAVLCTIVVGEFVDLSAASVLGLAATLVPVLNVMHHVNLLLACVLAVLAGPIVGAVNGALVVYLGVNTIVVTLGMSTLLLGLTLWSSGLNTVGGLDRHFATIANYSIAGLPVSFYYGIVLTAAFAYVLGFTPLGRHMRFIGANREVSRLAGVSVNRIRFGAFVVSGGIAAVGGVLVVASVGSFDPNSAASYLLPTFATVFLGAAIVQPGRFNPIGALIGTYFLETGVLGLQELGLASWISDVFYGGVLVVAVAISTLLGRRAR